MCTFISISCLTEMLQSPLAFPFPPRLNRSTYSYAIIVTDSFWWENSVIINFLVFFNKANAVDVAGSVLFCSHTLSWHSWRWKVDWFFFFFISSPWQNHVSSERFVFLHTPLEQHCQAPCCCALARVPYSTPLKGWETGGSKLISSGVWADNTFVAGANVKLVLSMCH